MKNRHKGETCLVLGNGRSLADVPLKFLKKYPSFGTNRIYLLDGFTPTYYVAVNENIINQSIEEINAIDATKFISAQFAGKIKGAHPLADNGSPHFSKNPFDVLYEGFSVTYVCLQLAYWMGFTTVLLVGVDHKYPTSNGNANVLTSAPNGNHFAKDYYAPGEIWNNPDLVRSAKAFEMAKEAFYKSRPRRKIVNLTPDSGLDVFKKGSISAW